MIVKLDTFFENAVPDVVKILINSGVLKHSSLSPSYLYKGHIRFVDNWYSSPFLFRHLPKCNTVPCGTVQLYQLHMPKITKKLKRGETECYRKYAVGIKIE